MIVDEKQEFLSQRELPRLALVSPRLVDDILEISAPGMPLLTVSRGGPRPNRRHGLGRSLRGDRRGAHAAEWLSTFLDVPPPGSNSRRRETSCESRIRRADDQVGFADGFSFLLTSRVAGRPESPSIDTASDESLSPEHRGRRHGRVREDRWKRIRIDGITFAVAKPCARCATTTTDQDTAERSHEPLRTLATFRHVAGRGVMFGQNLIHDRSGVIHVGADVELVE